MLAHLIDTWRGAGFVEIVVVLGHGAAELRERFEESLLRVEEGEGPVRWVDNPDWASGMFSSVRCGLAAATEGPSTHVAISPADLPFLSKSSLLQVLDAVRSPEANERTVFVPVCGRRRGHPLVIPAALVARVLSWPGDARLNRLFSEPDVQVLHLEGFDDSILHDVDEPADLQQAPAHPLPSSSSPF